MKNMGKMTKFMVPAKFSNWRTYTDNISPSAASITAASNMLASKAGAAAHTTSVPTSAAINKNTPICNTDRHAPATSLNASNQPRGSGAVSSRRITPISRSNTMDNELCMPLNSATMPSRPGSMYTLYST